MARRARRLAAVTLGVAACGGDDDSSSSSQHAAAAAAAAARAARSPCCCPSRRRPLRVAGPAAVRDEVKELCSDCKIIYSNADQDAAKQQQQAEAALTKGAKVLVLDPVDAASAGAIVTRAKQPNVPVDHLRPPDHRRGRSTTTSRSTTRRSASSRATPWSRSSRRTASQRADRDDQRRADGQQRQAVQAGRAQRHRQAAA